MRELDNAPAPDPSPVVPPPIPVAPVRAFSWTERFTFTGDGDEYFRIWIVNVLLTVITFGIYSAWAKVRRTQYFYRNTRLAGASFDYHADPVAILKGRIVAGGLFSGYYVAGAINPIAGAVAFLFLICLLPWLICRSLRFRMYNASYRGLRFQFNGSTKDAYVTFLVLPIVSMLSLFALAPLWHQRLKRYVLGNAAYGRTPFTFDASVSAFYRVYLIAGGLALGGIVAAVVVASAMFLGAGVSGAVNREGAPETIAIAGMFILIVIYMLGTVGMWAFTTARVRNLAWNHTQLGPHGFVSTLQARRLMFITVTNLLGVVFTLGLYKPFAEIRLTRYLLEAFTVKAAGRLEDFVAGERLGIGAMGDEAVEMFDIDVAL